MKTKISFKILFSVTSIFIAISGNSQNIYSFDGNVGIGTTVPGSPLSIVSGYGKYDFGSAGANFFQAKVENTATSGYGYSAFRSITNSTIEGMLVTYLSTDAAVQFGMARGGWTGIFHTGGNGLMIGTMESDPVLFGTNNIERMKILATGDVGIGTSTPQAKLDVNGKVFIGASDANTATQIAPYSLAVDGAAIFTKAVVKSKSNWPDYVFSPDYKMPELDSLEQFIKINKHLPDIPSAPDVDKNGIDLGSNQALLLKKIEELTLIVIGQNKRIENQQKIDEAQTQKIFELENKLNRLNKPL